MSNGSSSQQKFDLEPDLWHLHYRIVGHQTTWGIEYLQSYATYASMIDGYTALQAQPGRNYTVVDFLSPGLMPGHLTRAGSWFLHLDYYTRGTPSLQILIPRSSLEEAERSYIDHRTGIRRDGGLIVYAGITPPTGEPIVLNARSHP